MNHRYTHFQDRLFERFGLVFTEQEVDGLRQSLSEEPVSRHQSKGRVVYELIIGEKVVCAVFDAVERMPVTALTEEQLLEYERGGGL